MDVSVVPLRQFPHLLRETAELVNTEWPRSLSARMASLEEGGAALPCSLVMLCRNPQLGRTEVVGHARLVAVAGRSEAALVETVVVKKELRGRGHGRRIMQAAEKQATQLGCQTLHLSTHDKENFYRHLGYEDGSPVSPLRKCVARLSMEQTQNLLQDSTATPSISHQCLQPGGSISVLTPSLSSPPPPPPPPPLVPLETTKTTWLQKFLTLSQ